MKIITVAGRLTRNAELRRSQSGDPVLGFSVAVDDRSTRDKTALFFDCSIWGKRGEALERHLTKGTPVTVSGELGRREHDGKTYLTVRVNELTLQGGKQDSGARQEQGMYSDNGGGAADFGDEIPFAPEWR